MESALDAFKGKFPYASELFGVYQPLLGWRSRQTMQRVTVVAKLLEGQVLRGILNDPRVEVAIQEDPIFDLGGIHPPRSPEPDFFPRTEVGSYVVEMGRKIITEKGRFPTSAEWQTILSEKNMRDLVTSIRDRYAVSEKSLGSAALETNLESYLISQATRIEADKGRAPQ